MRHTVLSAGEESSTPMCQVQATSGPTSGASRIQWRGSDASRRRAGRAFGFSNAPDQTADGPL